MPDLVIKATDSRLGFEPPLVMEVSGTGDFSAQQIRVQDDVILEGAFLEKPADTALTLTARIGNTAVSVALIAIAPADALTSAFRLSKIPLPKGSTLTLGTTGAANGAKRLALIFRTARNGV